MLCEMRDAKRQWGIPGRTGYIVQFSETSNLFVLHANIGCNPSFSM